MLVASVDAAVDDDHAAVTAGKDDDDDVTVHRVISVGLSRSCNC